MAGCSKVQLKRGRLTDESVRQVVLPRPLDRVPSADVGRLMHVQLPGQDHIGWDKKDRNAEYECMLSQARRAGSIICGV